jgi:hypothetical protein
LTEEFASEGAISESNSVQLQAAGSDWVNCKNMLFEMGSSFSFMYTYLHVILN